MAYNNTGLLVAICILIGMVLVCHTMNFLYPRNTNKFYDLPMTISSMTTIPMTTIPITTMPPVPLPTQYNIISYDNNLGKIPCDSQAQLPCNILQQQQTQCSTPTKYKLSDSELALLYKDAYERVGEEILLRTLREMKKPITTETTYETTTTE
jgi:hypothetical protein